MSSKGLKVEYIKPEAISKAARNARTHSDEQIDQIVGSISEFGWTSPILVDEKLTIIAGHGRFEAAMRLAMDRVPVIRISGLSDSKKRALALADNKLALNAGWDEDLLKLELKELLEFEDVETAVIGFSEAELKRLLEDKEPPDATPQLAALTYSVIVDCPDEMTQSQVLERMEAEGYKCRLLIS